MAPDSPLQRALAEWRRAEQRLQATNADDPERPALEAEVTRLRTAYHALSETLHDVASHDAGGPGPQRQPEPDDAG